MKSTKKTQTAAELKAAEKSAREIFAKFCPEQVRMINAMRKALRKRLPSAFELVYEYRNWFAACWGPTENGYEGVVGIRGDGEGIRLFVNCTKPIPDPAKLLKGSGKQTRWIAVEKASELSRPEIVAIVEAAISQSPIPFAKDGSGELIVRGASAK